jgi:hypothetical protein
MINLDAYVAYRPQHEKCVFSSFFCEYGSNDWACDNVVPANLVDCNTTDPTRQQQANLHFRHYAVVPSVT